MIPAISNNQNPNFKALILSPNRSEWNKDLLDAALDSRYVQDFVSRAADKKEDVTMAFKETVPEGVIPYGYKILNFKLNSKSQSVSIKSVSKPIMKKHEIVYTDIYSNKAKDVAKDIAAQLRAFGVVECGNTTEEKLAHLKKLAEFEQ